MISYLTSDILLGNQIHAIPQRRDQTDTGVAIEGSKLVLRDASVDVSDW